MANEQYAFLKSSNVPTREGLQQAIDRAGFDLKIDPGYVPRTNVGFDRLQGVASGQEWLNTNPDAAIRAVLVYDVRITLKTGKTDALIPARIAVEYSLSFNFGSSSCFLWAS